MAEVELRDCLSHIPRKPRKVPHLKPLSLLNTPRRTRVFPALHESPSPTLLSRATPTFTPRVPNTVRLPEIAKRPLVPAQSLYQFPTLPSYLRNADHAIRVSAVSSLSQIGRKRQELKPQNQDRVLVLTPVPGFPQARVYAVFDGHGENGHSVSQYLKETVPEKIAALLASLPAAPVPVLVVKLTAMFAQLQSEISDSTLNVAFSGSTAVIVLQLDDLLICANVGDSRAVVVRKEKYWKAQSLTRDHKPGLEEEDNRIFQHQGVVRAVCDAQQGPIGPLRVFAPNKGYPGLAMSRSIGDEVAHRLGVTAEPEITLHPLSNQDRALVLASDGLFDCMSNEEVLVVVKRFEPRRDAEQCCKQLVKVATRRWEEMSVNVDDISVVVVYFK